MMPMLRRIQIVRWIIQHKTTIAIILGMVILIVAGIWFWGVLVGYVEPKGPTGRKDVVQAFALIIAGILGIIGAGVGLSNLRIAQENLKHNQRTLEHNQEALRVQVRNQRELEERRAQEDALQSYFEQMGGLLTTHSLVNTDREDIKQLAQAQTITVAGRLDQDRKAQLLLVLYGAGLIKKGKRVVDISGANFIYANLVRCTLTYVDLSGVILRYADLEGTDLSDADLDDADLSNADLRGANTRDANVTTEQLATCKYLWDGTMPNYQKFED
jgi:hypothetical protein